MTRKLVPRLRRWMWSPNARRDFRREAERLVLRETATSVKARRSGPALGRGEWGRPAGDGTGVGAAAPVID